MCKIGRYDTKSTDSINCFFNNMNTVEPIRNPQKLIAIKRNLKKLDDPRDYLLFTLGVNLALRISDLLDLNVGDFIDSKGKVVSYISLRENKTNKELRIKLNEASTEALKYYFSKRRPIDPDRPLFASHRTGKRLDRTQAWRLIRKWCAEVDLDREKYGTHSLRKTFGYIARVYEHVPIEKIQATLGHSNTEITKRYIGISADEITDVRMKVNI